MNSCLYTANVKQHVDIGAGRICLLTNLCTLGYQFNPVSFYFCYDELGKPLCSVVEVGNTFRELKPYFLGKDVLADGRFRQRVCKYFYVSPFIDMDSWFDFGGTTSSVDGCQSAPVFFSYPAHHAEGDGADTLAGVEILVEEDRLSQEGSA